jgi:hypothetical protein
VVVLKWQEAKRRKVERRRAELRRGRAAPAPAAGGGRRCCGRGAAEAVAVVQVQPRATLSFYTVIGYH